MNAIPLAARLPLFATPHRLLFFVGSANVLLAMLWWTLFLTGVRWPALALPAPASVPPGWLHAALMQYQMLASFVFGFLLTVFPRWMGLPELSRWRYVPVGLGLFGGQLATLSGAFGAPAALQVGGLMTLAGWVAGMSALLSLLWRDPGTTWHARACFVALVCGLVGLCCWLAFLFGGSPRWAFCAIKLGGFGFLFPMYFTVAHRMFPFFAQSAMPGYRPWRPLWLLAALWLLAFAHLGLELMHAYRRLWIADAPMLALSLWMLWRWWPRGHPPPLLRALFLGLAWLPVAFALYLAQSATYALAGVYALGRAPAHALFVGFFGSVLVAMVTRVSQGHSGRPLVMPAVARYAFVSIQCVAVLRVAAELAPDGGAWQAVAAAAWLFALAPWALRIGHIVATPRVDGKAG